MGRIHVIMRFDKRTGVPVQKLLIPGTNTVGTIMQRTRQQFLSDCKHVTKHTGLFIFFSTDVEQRMFPVTTTLHDIFLDLGAPDVIVADVAMENAFGTDPEQSDRCTRPRFATALESLAPE